MVKKKVVIISCIVSVMIIVLCLIADFNKYQYNSKKSDYDNSGIIFTITVFDGKTESQPFVKSLGHSWISVENETDHSIYIKDYEILPDEQITFSVWATSEHFGVFFNMESTFNKQYGRYDKRQSLSTNINESKMEIISEFIDDNNSWTAVKNCSWWSLHLWNEIVDDSLKLKTQTIMYTPERIQKSIDEYTNIEINKDFSKTNKIFYYKDGVRTELELCD